MRKLTKHILILINLAVAFSLCFAYLCNYITPSLIWHFSFFGLAYPFLILLNIGFVMFWLWRRKKVLFISLFCILLGFSNLGRYFQFNSTAENKSVEEDVKVLTYNVRIFNHYGWEKAPSVRDSILNYVADQSADIVCMQEFLTRPNRKNQSERYVKKKLKSTPNCHISYSRKSKSGSTRFGIATFSKFPIIHKGNIEFEDSHNSCIYSDLVIKGDTFRLYNVHLQSTKIKKYDDYIMDSLLHFNSTTLDEVKTISSHLKSGFIQRAEQVESIQMHMESSPYPIIICGDFNDTPVSYTYHQLIGNKKDAFRESGFGMSRTYRGKLPSYRIDYVLYDPLLQAKDYKVDRVPFSDHYPVIGIIGARKN